MKFASPVVLGTGLLLAQGLAFASSSHGKSVDFDLPPQPLSAALNAFARQSDLRIVFYTDVTAEAKSAAVHGRLTPEAALRILLDDAGLTFEFASDDSVQIWAAKDVAARRGNADVHLAQAAGPASGSSASTSGPSTPSAGAQPDSESATVQAGESAATTPRGIPQILVKGTRSINSDIERTKDDTQPYVVFDADTIQQSNATSIDDFLKTRLPMNTQFQNGGQLFNGNNSSINLRGLGANQTLILVDGRRQPGLADGSDIRQPDINGIPLSMIERIEILPSTASGIYGGGATGGVVNIITRQNFSGFQVSASYGDTLNSDVANKRIDGAAGFNLEGGRTHVLVSASFSSSDPLFAGDRDFIARARDLQLAHNSAAIFDDSTPPLGYLTNIRSSDGSNLQLRPAFGGAQLSSPITSVPRGYAGAASDGGAGLVANAGKYDLGMPDDLNGARRTLLFDTDVKSTSLNLRRTFTDSLDAFANATYSENNSFGYLAIPSNSITLPASAPNNPFTTDVNVRFPVAGLNDARVSSKLTTIRGLAGFTYGLPHGWNTGLDYSWARERNKNSQSFFPLRFFDTLNALSDGTLDVMRDVNAHPLDWSPYKLALPTSVRGPSDATLNDSNLRLSGPLIGLPAGPIVLSTLVEWRKEQTDDTFSDSLSAFSGTSSTIYNPGASQEIGSFYAELRAPLFSAKNAMPYARELEVQVSIRHDKYKTRAPSPGSSELPSRDGPFPELTYSSNEVSATKYTLGLRFMPVEDLTLRASYGTGFLPPAITQIVPFDTTTTAPFSDPKRGNVPNEISFDETLGGNPGLSPEESKSWSAGIILTPRLVSGLRFSIDYTSIEKTNEIATLDDQQIINLEDRLPGRVTRATLTPADAALGYTAGQILRINSTYLNVAATRLKALDIQTDYAFKSEGYGNFTFYLVATKQPKLERQAAVDADFIDSVGFNGGILKWRGNAGFQWERGAWVAGWNTQYYHSYYIVAPGSTADQVEAAALNQGSTKLPRQIYHDAFLGYRFNNGPQNVPGLLQNVDVMFGVQNVFDKDPPVIATADTTNFGTSGYSPYADPRLRRYLLTVRKSF